MKEPLIEVKNASAGYGDSVILHNINITVNDNDFIGIIGPNGGGKTTLLKLILGQISPIEGSVINHIQPTKLRGAVGYLPQVSTIDRKFPITVIDVVLSGLMSSKGMRNRFSKLEKESAEAILRKTGIYDYRNKTIGELSGGQLQRAFLCRALISNPFLLILDEPNTFVDNRFEKELYNLLREINERMAIIMVSHDIGTITSYVKTIACVNRQLHYHNSNTITQEQLKVYDCPIQLITHGQVPHTVLKTHTQQ
ncbi:metal ABC transporter ATP-binding protein [Williamwhitmania taraxaci]|uniref:Zinc transport system ATP-binding protein n=1 Tax=Williamwhitmania taraxaci TaxID=1640674 RepID=A0A1G6J8T9_9BACT|nr:ABC transporter ATP-binding protein [Williamwhitmania taraxaci]SDC15077.1 zinc transport system ATP-binding protein [Williamwhitmania taraxaci]